MRRATITMPDDLEMAIAAFQGDQDAPPSLTAIAQAALREYLAQRGYLAPKRSLRVTPAPRGSGESTVSIEHDRFLAQADE
jgi:hypothetical protein